MCSLPFSLIRFKSPNRRMCPQAEYLRKGYWAGLDVENLVEELEALGRSEQRELGSYLQVLLVHILKCQYQPEQRTKSWDDAEVLNANLT